MEALAAATPGLRFFSGQGCDDCRQMRYRGRIGVQELLEVDDEMRRLIAQDAGVAALREQAGRSGMQTMRADALAKASQGLTSVEEVLRVCGG
jgi:type II secretory ATPase GspE/PulE/Tfp pilus assembly ATPase PilB-like protein